MFLFCHVSLLPREKAWAPLFSQSADPFLHCKLHLFISLPAPPYLEPRESGGHSAYL